MFQLLEPILQLKSSTPDYVEKLFSYITRLSPNTPVQTLLKKTEYSIALIDSGPYSRNYLDYLQTLLEMKTCEYDIHRFPLWFKTEEEFYRENDIVSSMKGVYKNDLLEKGFSLQADTYWPEGETKDYTFNKPSTIFGINDELSVEHEGATMHHCVFRLYAEKIANGQYKTIFMRPKTENGANVTIGLTPFPEGLGKWYVDQTMQFEDRPITPEQAQAIRAWVNKSKNVYFIDRPTGWPQNIPFESKKQE